MSTHVVRVEPGDARARAIAIRTLQEAGATVDLTPPEERRGADQVLEAVRITFEITGDIGLVVQGFGAAARRFPGLRFWIDENEPQGRHER